MLHGYTGKIIEVNLTTSKITTVTPEEATLRHYIGGRGLAAKILWDRLGPEWRTIDPLGPENLFLALTGPLTGYIPGARICVSGKSPSSNGILGSTVGGEFAMELKCAGYDGIIVVGQAKDPVYILVTDEETEIMEAKKLWGLGGKQTVKAINIEVRELLQERQPLYGLQKEPGILYIGPAGENSVRTAAVMQKWSHACGFGGYGALMGSKNLKAIVAKGKGAVPNVADPTELLKILETLYDAAFRSHRLRLGREGSTGYTAGAIVSAEPVRNWQEEWHDERSYAGVNFWTRNWIKRYWSDYGCPCACRQISFVKTGPFKGTIIDGPDYEQQAFFGPNIGNFDPEGCLYLTELVDDLGLSSINSSNTMGFVAELYQRGILTTEDLNGIKPKWGDAKAFGELAKLIAERRGIGDILAEGTYRAAKKIEEIKGTDVMQYAIQFKGVEVGGWGLRAMSTVPSRIIRYAVGTQGGDHTSSAGAVGGEAGNTLADSLVVCTYLNWYASLTPELQWKLFTAVTGWEVTQEEWINIHGRRIIQIQRAALLLGGPDVIWDPTIDDDNPPRWYEPLPSGPHKGKAPTRAAVLEARRTFYEDMGWDANGIPSTEELRKLGLDDVDKALKTLRKEP